MDLPNLKLTKKLKTHSKVVRIAVVAIGLHLAFNIIGAAVMVTKYSCYSVTRVPGLA